MINYRDMTRQFLQGEASFEGEEEAKLLSEIDRMQPAVDSGGLTAAQAAKINAEQDRLEDERILQEFISDLEELVMTALQNEVPERELSKQLMMLGRSLRS